MTTFTETQHPRDIAGKWTEKEHSAPEASLGAVEEVEPLSREQSRELLENVTEFASMYSARYSMNAATRDDIVQTTIVDVLGQHKRGKSHVLNRNFLNRASRAVSQRYLNPDVHHTALTGRRIFRERVNEIEQDLGRSLLPGELDRLANEVRMEQPPGQRPTVGFHLNQSNISIETPIGRSDGAELVLGDVLTAEPGDFGGAPSEAAGALDRIADGELSVDTARKGAWTLIAGADGPPLRGSGVRDDHVLRSRVAELGGASAAMRSWEDGELSNADTELLFSPFDVRTQDGREEVASVLRRHRDYADDLYSAAVDGALDNSIDAAAHRAYAELEREEQEVEARKAARSAARARQRAAAKARA